MGEETQQSDRHAREDPAACPPPALARRAPATEAVYRGTFEWSLTDPPAVLAWRSLPGTRSRVEISRDGFMSVAYATGDLALPHFEIPAWLWTDEHRGRWQIRVRRTNGTESWICHHWSAVLSRHRAPPEEAAG